MNNNNEKIANTNGSNFGCDTLYNITINKLRLEADELASIMMEEIKKDAVNMANNGMFYMGLRDAKYSRLYGGNKNYEQTKMIVDKLDELLKRFGLKLDRSTGEDLIYIVDWSKPKRK